MFREKAVVFSCNRCDLLGIATIPEECGKVGVVIVVGGAQYRVGSNRQFTLLARHLAKFGIASFRFDYRGIGDSEGQLIPGVVGIEDDTRSAIDAFLAEAMGVHEVALWGICGAATFAAIYAPDDKRVSSVILLNPWLRTLESKARATLKYYYASRLKSPEAWRRLAMGQANVFRSATSAVQTGIDALRGVMNHRRLRRGKELPGGKKRAAQDLRILLADSMSRFRGKVLVILSGQDLTAIEFRDALASEPGLRGLLDAANMDWREIEDANHTFARADWRDLVATWTVDWCREAQVRLPSEKVGGTGLKAVVP